MKLKLLPALALMAFTSFPALALEIGKPAPEFHVKDIYGHEQSLGEYKGKIIVLEWTNPGCPFVHKHYDSGNMQQVQKYAVSKDVVWLSINSSAEGKEGHLNVEGAKDSLAKNKSLTFSYILDAEGTLGHLYGAKTTPHMFVVDKEGNLAYEGAIDDKPTPSADDIAGAKNYVKAAIDELSEGKKVETPQTRAYGCGVKYKD